MKNTILKRFIAVMCCTTCVITMSGCNIFTSGDVKSYSLAKMLTEQEVIDYYAKAMDYDSVITRSVDVHSNTYVEQDIIGEKAEKLKLLTEQCQGILAQDAYELTEENAKIMSEDTFNYIKASIDNEYLTNGKTLSMTGALGYYFVDVQYDIARKQTGNFNQLTTLLGLDNVFIKNADDTYVINSAYLVSAANKLNDYYYNNKIMKVAEFNAETGQFSIVPGVPKSFEIMSETQGINVDDISSVSNGGDDSQINEDGTPKTDGDTAEGENTEGEENVDDTEETGDAAEGESTEETTTEEENTDAESTDETSTDTETETDASVEAEVEEGQSYNSIVSADRKVQFNVADVNKVAGSSITASTYFPNLETVYQLPQKEGDISGYGICIAGGNGLKVFGLDREKLAGTLTIRYVFKDDSEGTGDILGTNAFVKEENITTGFNVSDQNVLIPDFLMSQLKQTVERVDRIQSNYDITGAMSGNVYEDMGYAVLLGYKGVNTNTLKHMSTIRQVISRDTTNNSYLAEVETTVIDGARTSDVYGTYRDKSYVVIQQQGDQFIVVDWLRMSRETVKEPEINPDTAIQKRLVALNLAGEIPQESKDAIVSLMSNLYTSGTNRILRGPKEITDADGNKINIEVGMYDCFQDDVTMLSSEDLEYANSKLQNILVKEGTSIQSIYTGTVTEWIGGYDNQAEFTTEELVSYTGKDKGWYMQVYYLVSRMNDKWVIDERTVIDEREVSGSDMDAIKTRVGQ